MQHKTGVRKKRPSSSHFILQKTIYDCSPTSVYNALVWLGINPDESTYDRIFKICKTKKSGSHTSNVNKALRWAAKKWGFKCEYKMNVLISEITEHIKKGNAVIIGHKLPWEKPPELHHSFWYDYQDGNLIGVNVKWRCMYACMTPFELRRIARDDDVWFITKEEEDD